MNLNAIATNILSILETNQCVSDVDAADAQSDNLFHLNRIRHYVAHNEPITMVLPAFPAKSPNLDKTLGKLPDLGEVLALQRLQQLCEQISQIYPSGARLIICSDGRVFGDLVKVSDADVLNYNQVIRNIIADFNLHHLSIYGLENYYNLVEVEAMRHALVKEYGTSVETIRQTIKSDRIEKNLFNGIHRFIFEDQLFLANDRSRNSVRKASKPITYQVIQRSHAWSELLNQVYPDVVRLSVHPYPKGYSKLGIQLVPTDNYWITPWHSVVLEKNAHYQLIKRKEAIALGAQFKQYRVQFGYYSLD
jgi:L-tyrosine isonitrile synthase